MTSEMIRQAKLDLHRRAAERRGRDGNLFELWPFFTEEMRREDDELACRSMALSCVCYGTEYNFYDERTKTWGQYGLDYAEKIGDERALEIFRDQRDYMRKHATIHCGVHEDPDGCSYNSITWN